MLGLSSDQKVHEKKNSTIPKNFSKKKNQNTINGSLFTSNTRRVVLGHFHTVKLGPTSKPVLVLRFVYPVSWGFMFQFGALKNFARQSLAASLWIEKMNGWTDCHWFLLALLLPASNSAATWSAVCLLLLQCIKQKILIDFLFFCVASSYVYTFSCCSTAQPCAAGGVHNGGPLLPRRGWVKYRGQISLHAPVYMRIFFFMVIIFRLKGF